MALPQFMPMSFDCICGDGKQRALVHGSTKLRGLLMWVAMHVRTHVSIAMHRCLVIAPGCSCINYICCKTAAITACFHAMRIWPLHHC
jgi:hypothetical protein